MTIIIEREALLRVLAREPSGISSSIACSGACIPSDGEYVLVDIPKPLSSVEKSQVGPTSDDQSTCSLSTDSLSSGSCHSFERRVSFAETLVSDEWTRPRTPRDQVLSLFYSTEETQRYVSSLFFLRRSSTESRWSQFRVPTQSSAGSKPKHSIFSYSPLFLFYYTIGFVKSTAWSVRFSANFHWTLIAIT